MITCELSDSGPALELRVTGDGDVAHALSFREQLVSVLAVGRDVVVHLEGVTTLDGAGVQVLVALGAFVARSGGVFTVTGHSDVALRAIEMAGAESLLGGRSARAANDVAA